MVKATALTILALSLSSPLLAGVYAFVDRDTDDPPLFAIVHPPGFAGAGGQISIAVCASPGNPELVQPIQDSFALWNSLTPATGNCTMCMRVEDISPDMPFGVSGESVLVHELGHTLGLDHTNLNLSGTQTSATNAVRTTVVDFGADGIRGSSDDRHFPQPPSMNAARIIHWFRNVDNNPMAIDGTIIDATTFTRARSELPTGHTWPANGNSDYRTAAPADDTADLLGSPNTQAVMYSFVNEDLVYTGLSADDVNTVQMGMTGLDNTASTADDYTFVFTFEPDCSQADIEVSLVDPFTDPDFIPGVLGVTVAQVTGIPDPPNQTQHYFVGPNSGQARVLIKLNDNITWDFEIIVVFDDGFESGDTSSWDVTVP